jgi:hypothetical protein
MARAPRPLAAFVLLVCLLGAEQTSAAPPGGDARPTNSFALVTVATPPRGAAAPRPNGVGVPPAQSVVRNPYQVPLLSNAGTLGSAR